jgi:hypothetical protein
MVKAAEDRSRCNSAKLLDDAMERAVLGQRSMSSLLVVVACIGGQDSAQVHLAYHGVVQALPIRTCRCRAMIWPGQHPNRLRLSAAHSFLPGRSKAVGSWG